MKTTYTYILFLSLINICLSQNLKECDSLRKKLNYKQGHFTIVTTDSLLKLSFKKKNNEFEILDGILLQKSIYNRKSGNCIEYKIKTNYLNIFDMDPDTVLIRKSNRNKYLRIEFNNKCNSVHCKFYFSHNLTWFKFYFFSEDKILIKEYDYSYIQTNNKVKYITSYGNENRWEKLIYKNERLSDSIVFVDDVSNSWSFYNNMTLKSIDTTYLVKDSVDNINYIFISGNHFRKNGTKKQSTKYYPELNAQETKYFKKNGTCKSVRVWSPDNR